MKISLDRYKQMLSGLDVKTLEDIRTLSHSLIHNHIEPSLGKNDLATIANITRALTIPQQDFRTITQKMHTNWHIFESEKINIQNATNLIEAINQILGQSAQIAQLVKIKDELFIKCADSTELFIVSDDLDSRKSRLLLFLSDQTWGIAKNIDSVFDEIKLARDQYTLDLKEKKQIIKNTMKEIQRTMRKQSIPVTLKLKWNLRAVAIEAR